MGFSITQHFKDLLLFHLIKEFLCCDAIIKEKDKYVIRYRTDNFSLVCENIIPFYSNNVLQSSKVENYLDFSKVSKKIKDK